MAYQPMDAFQCFTSISENVPSWITRVTDLATYTAKKHTEFSEEYKKLALAQQTQQRRRKNSSVHSIRPGSELRADGSLSGLQTSQVVLVEVAKPSSTGSKRNGDAASVLSGEGSRVLPRQQLIIHYDGHMQKELEQVVRDIGAARNSIRKGKMSQVMRRPNLTMEMFRSRSRDSLRSPQLATDNFIQVQAEPPRLTQKADSFDSTDKHLETAQSLCETAAHQFLRCGNCSSQLETILAKFDLILETAKKEVGHLSAEKQVDSGIEAAEPELTSQAVLKPVGVAEDGKPLEPGSADIEVDDSPSDSSVSIDITAFRSSRFRT
ncbi:hypothetical protein BGW36DRAFT_13526 [Talaromyces proteolyticus]|uniref:Uncharacterized protein n=1 Tax=Talaromyces proteolyticus TaxID=1131652 RepID=A0AAD4L3U7_9EURO|nr:uncharacterized protein BGW36DRAFT_13526 [Talaromyces proteolyticus]KAH8705442.1 hypothetical protein BGW36DRAFT_13526 [Talaromyces proteolyticus]